jgi:REP element-mobilizing transposase RayT
MSLAPLRRRFVAGNMNWVAWLVVPNHVHLVLRPAPECVPGAAVRNIKGRSARAANLVLGVTGKPFWAKDYFDRRIRDSDHEARVTRYIEKNPVKAGLCESAGKWQWSSAWVPLTPEDGP